MLESFATIIFFIGFVGMSIIVLRKIPVLAELPIQQTETEKSRVLKTIKEKINANKIINSFSADIILQKVLSKIRILTLKTDNKTSIWLAKLRQRSIEKKKNFSDNYWKELKKSNKRQEK